MVSSVDSKRFFVRAKSYNVSRGKYFVSITLMDNETNEDCSKTFDEVIKSVSITD